MCTCVFCKTYKLREQPKMVTNPVTPCQNKDCWCQVDKIESESKSDTKTPFAAYFKDTPSWYESPPPGEYRERDPMTGGEKGKKLAELGAIDPASLLKLAKVAGYGSLKYSRLNYMKGYKWSLSYDAMQRHLLAFWDGESFDPESGFHHLAHAAWHCMTLMSYDEREIGTDDRYGSDW